MKDIEQLRATIKRQAAEIRSLKAQCRDLKEEWRAYRRFYFRVMFRYSDLIGLLEQERARYAEIVSDSHAIVETNGSEPNALSPNDKEKEGSPSPSLNLRLG